MVPAWRSVQNDLMQDVSCGFWEEDHKVNDAMLRPTVADEAKHTEPQHYQCNKAPLLVLFSHYL